MKFVKHDISIVCICIFFFNDTATTEIYTLSLHDALPISPSAGLSAKIRRSSSWITKGCARPAASLSRSEEHTSELQSPCNLVCRLLLEKKKHNTFGIGERIAGMLVLDLDHRDNISCAESWNILSFFFNDTATTEIYTLSLHDALPISASRIIIRSQPLRDQRQDDVTVELSGSVLGEA